MKQTVIIMLLIASPAAAQNWERTSNVLPSVNVGASMMHAGNSGPRWACLGLNTGIAMGITEILKRTVREDRPDHSDRRSFPSGHTTLAAVTSGPWLSVGIPLTLGTAAGRIGARKHHWWDTVAGGLIGFSVQRWGCHSPESGGVNWGRR